MKKEFERKMKFISEKYVPAEWIQLAEENNSIVNIRLCRECPHFEREHPTIDSDGDLGFCTYRTDFFVMDDEPINWYFVNENDFCNEDTIVEEDV